MNADVPVRHQGRARWKRLPSLRGLIPIILLTAAVVLIGFLGYQRFFAPAPPVALAILATGRKVAP